MSVGVMYVERMLEHRIGHPRNEASGVTSVHNQRILDAFGWDVAFWIAGDEGEADECVSVLGRRIDQKERVVGLARARRRHELPKPGRHYHFARFRGAYQPARLFGDLFQPLSGRL